MTAGVKAPGAKALCLGADAGAAPFQRAGRSAVYGANGMCATSHPLASATALQVLRDGGNAVDAGVAAAFLLTLCEPMMTSLGGDSFALYAPPGGEPIALNASGRAPAALDPHRLRQVEGAGIGTESANSVTVPGAVGGLCALMERYGRLDLEQVAAPARRYARDGAPVAPRTAHDWARSAPRLSAIARRHLLRDDGAPYAAGDLFRASGVADALDLIVRHGAKGFYEGPVAEDIVATLRAAGGAHTLEDFAAAEPFFTTPIFTDYRGYEVLEHPPNVQGAAALLMLDMLSPMAMQDLDPLGADRIHLEIEASRLAYEARDRFLCDPEVDSGGLARLRAPDMADRLSREIDMARARPWTPSPALEAEAQRHTVYLSVVDRDGGALALIMSLFHAFGSGLASERYGLMLHNRGCGFTLTPGHPNEARGGKRPLHTLSPGLVRRQGRIVMAFGVMGGQYQAHGHARLVSNLLDYGLDLQTAIDLPRAFHQNQALVLESGHAPLTVEGLASKGHRLAAAESPLGGAQAIWIEHDRGVLCGASDPRKDGCALGY